MPSDKIQAAVDALLDAMEEEGVDRVTAEAQIRYILPSEPTVVGNYADLQRMGAAATTGSIPTGPGQDDVQSTDIKEAFTMPPDPGLREQVGNEGGPASVPTPPAPGETGTGTPPEPAQADQPTQPAQTQSAQTQAAQADQPAAQPQTGQTQTGG